MWQKYSASPNPFRRHGSNTLERLESFVLGQICIIDIVMVLHLVRRHKLVYILVTTLGT